MAKDKMFSPTQEQFITTFTDEFIRELLFIVDISRGRAQARPSFFDQLIGKINLGANLLGTLTSFFPAASVAIGTASQVAICIATGFQYLYEAEMNSNVERVVTGGTQPDVLLRLMIEGVAREAARRHEFFLNMMCDPEAVDLFAIVGVARVLQYLSDHKSVFFTSENLIKGLIEGKSGAGQQGFQNNQIPCRHRAVPSVSAETVYGHSAHMDLQGRYYVKEKVRSYFKSTDLHFVKMMDKPAGKNIPKAGVILLRPTEIETYGYVETVVTSEIEDHLTQYRPGYVFVTRSDIEHYIATQRSMSEPLSLREHCGHKGVICREDLSGLDLERADFSGVDFAGSKFINTTLNHVNFEAAYLVGADLSQAKANDVNFRHANLSLISATDAFFVGSDFIHAQVFYSSFTRTTMSNIQFIGSEWNGSDLSTMITSSDIKIDLNQLSVTINRLTERQDAQETRLIDLERRIGRFLLDQDQRVVQSVMSKLQRLKQRALDDEEMTKELECYIPVQATLNIRSKQHFDLETKTLELLQTDKKVILLLGGAGEGKSTFNRYLYKKLWENFTEGNAIPVFISLPSLENPTTQLLQEYFQREEFTVEEIAYLHTHHAFTFILDGYDEMNTTDANLYVSNRLNDWQAKIIIACRTQYLTQFIDYQDHFIPFFTADHSSPQGFQELTVVPFKKDQIDAYITKYLSVNTEDGPWADLETYRQHIHTLPGLSDLVATPFLLMIALKIMPVIVNKYAELEEGLRTKVTKSELYDAFMQWWFRRGKIKALTNFHGNSKGYHDITVEFQRRSEALAIEMKHADVMQVRYFTNDKKLEKKYGDNIELENILSITSDDLSDISFEENTMVLLYVQNCPEPEKQWRIVARNNAGGLTYNAKTGWLMVSELEQRWSARTTSIVEHQQQVREKAKALEYATKQLYKHTPETLPETLKKEIFDIILLGLTHPWEYFFDLDNPQTQRILPGIPVKPTDHGGYAFIHAEILQHFYTRAIKREETLSRSTARGKKPWDTSSSSASTDAMPALAQFGTFPPAPPVPVGNTTIIHQTIIQQAPASAPKKRGCTIA